MKQPDDKMREYKMRYRAECVGYSEEVSPWFDTEDEAWDWLETVPCRISGKPKCDACQAEWYVFEEGE